MDDNSGGTIIRYLTCISILMLALVSCAPVASRIESSVEVPQQFSASGETVLPERWWLSFDDPVLNKLVEKALSNNFSLRSAWERLAQAEAIMHKEGSGRYPALDAQAGGSRTSSGGEAGAATVSGQQEGSFSKFSLGLVASYELDLWGRIQSRHKAAMVDVKASEEDLQAAAITLSSLVALTWYRLVEQYGQMELLNRQLETNRQVLELVTLRFRRGQVGATDVLQQRQLVESRRGEIAAAQSRAEVLEHQLAVLLGHPPHARFAEKVDKLVPLPPLPETGVPAELIQRRPDLRHSYYSLMASDHRAATAVVEQFPRISLSGQVSTSAGNVSDLFDNWLSNLALNLVAPIIDGGYRRAEVERTRAVVSQRLHEYSQVILESLTEVEDALTQEAKQRELIESLRRQMELSEQVIQRVQDSYVHGALDYLRVLDALLTHQRLERTLLEANLRLIEYRINLCRALGGGWEMVRPDLLMRYEKRED